MNRLTEALRWHDRGFAVIPIHYISLDGTCSCKVDCGSTGKHPALKSWTRYQVTRPSRGTVEAWFEPGGKYELYNIGVITGQVSGNVVVIDVDGGPGKEGKENILDFMMQHEEFPQTLTVNTGGGGLHYFYKIPKGMKGITDKNTLGKDVDGRGEGGLVVVPPSEHHSGDFYSYRDDSLDEPADCPEWLLPFVVQQDESRTDSASTQDQTIDMWGNVLDGREGYMMTLIAGTIRTWWGERGRIPTLEELIEDAWPHYLRKAKARGRSLDEDGRGLAQFTKKSKYWIKLANEGRMKILQDVDPGSEHELSYGEAKELPPPEKQIKLTDHWLKNYSGDPPEQVWLIENKLPLGVSGLIAGQGGVGKSFLMLDLALKVGGGDQSFHQEYALGGKVADNGCVVYFTAEDSRDAIHRRIHSIQDSTIRERAGENVIILPLSDLGGVQPFLHSGFNGLEQSPEYKDIRKQLMDLNEQKKIKLIIIDPLQPFSNADINADPAAAQHWWSMMNELAAKLNATILVTHHMRKEGSWSIRKAAQAREAIRGTTALVDGARFAYALWLMPESDEIVLAQRMGFEPGTGHCVCGSVVKANDYADFSIQTFIKSDSGLLQDRTSEVLEILDQSSTLEPNQVASIFSEIRRRWVAENPFAIGTNTGRSFIGWLKNEYGMSHNSAKQYMNSWLNHGYLINTLYSSKGKISGLKVVNEPNLGTPSYAN